MSSPFIIPLAGFALAVIIVAIVHLVKIRDLEIEAHQRLRLEEMEHQRKMRELEMQLEQVRQADKRTG
jgi:ADP-ribosylglycohydrolase